MISSGLKLYLSLNYAFLCIVPLSGRAYIHDGKIATSSCKVIFLSYLLSHVSRKSVFIPNSFFFFFSKSRMSLIDSDQSALVHKPISVTIILARGIWFSDQTWITSNIPFKLSSLELRSKLSLSPNNCVFWEGLTGVSPKENHGVGIREEMIF